MENVESRDGHPAAGAAGEPVPGVGELIQLLFDGPLDIVGDVHGEIGPLGDLLAVLGYDRDGGHPDGRRLVFVGDLTDRGPDSPAVVRLVAGMVEAGRAQCILGNHELNLLLDHDKPENGWFKDEPSRGNSCETAADEATRDFVLEFFASLPMALERSDLRIAHACWDEPAIALAREATDVVGLCEEHEERIDRGLLGRDLLEVERSLAHQNLNPVRMITSGPEERAPERHFAGERWRDERRVKWWESDRGGPVCVFGHYSMPVDQSHDFGRAICVDYGVGRRAKERTEVGDEGPFVTTRLAALRWPEREMVFDTGRS